MRIFIGMVLLVFLGAVGVFALQNTQAVTVHFLKWGATAPLALLTVGVYLLGMLSGWSVMAFLRRSIEGVSAASSSR
jgi:putative membrane protein